MVGFYNDQIKGWYSTIEQNEKYKVDLFKFGINKQNVSWGGGSEITETVTTSKSFAQTLDIDTLDGYRLYVERHGC